MKNLLCAAALGLLAASACQAVTLTSDGVGGYSGAFSSDVNGLFIDTFTFTPTSVAGDVKISLTPTGPVNFFTALLNGQGFSFFPESGNTSFDFGGVVTMDQPLELQVFGFAGDALSLSAMDGSYAGNIIISAVPEPGAWLLFLAGAAALAGAQVRRRV